LRRSAGVTPPGAFGSRSVAWTRPTNASTSSRW